MEKSIFLVTINATKHGYSDEEDNINKILSIFKNEETKDITNYSDFQKEMDSIIGNRNYFIFKWNKDIFDKLLNIEDSNLKKKEKKSFYIDVRILWYDTRRTNSNCNIRR